MMFRGDRLKVLRQRLGLSQDNFATMVGASQRMIGRYESGESDPTAEVVARLARHLGVTADYLLGLTDDPQATITESDLSPLERQLVMAFRRGEITEALSLAAELAKSR